MRSMFLAFVVAAALPLVANAAIVETLSTSTVVSYQRGNGSYTSIAIGPGASNLYEYSVRDDTPGDPFSLNVSLISTTEGGDFAFEHNVYVQGTGFALLDTTLTISLTNTGAAPAYLRLNSLIDPGHLAATGSNSGLNTFFQFTVAQDGTDLYNVHGSQLSGEVPPQDLRLAGLHKYTDFNAPQPISVADWSATPVNHDLAVIAPGATSIVTYETRTGAYDDSNNATPCVSLATCHGTQIGFGDPGRNGGVIGVPQLISGNGKPGSPVIGFHFNPYSVPIAFVPQGTPDPVAPPLLPAPNYAPVPEPLAAALFGLATLALAARRRHA